MFMKYIVINDMGFEEIIVFSNTISHDIIAKNHKIVSAGQIILNINEILCTGESTTLNIHSRPKIQIFLFNNLRSKYVTSTSKRSN